MKKRLFKSLESAEQAGADLKTEILHANFRAKSIKSEGEGENEVIKISGYASTKDRDRYWDVVNPKAFKKTMETYMTNPMLLLQHNMDKQIWVITDYKIDKTGLLIDGEVKYTAGDPELFEKITNWDLKGFSIWFRIRELEFIEEEIDWKECWTLHILELELLEISVVTIPANPYTLMKSLTDLLGKFWEAEKEKTDIIEDAETVAPENNPESEKTDEAESEKESEDEKEVEVPEVEEKEEETDTPSEEETPEESEDEETEEKPKVEEIETEEPEKNIDPEKPQKKEFEKEEETDNIESEESDEAEKSSENPDTPEEGWTEEPEKTPEAEKGFTVKMLKKLLEPEMEKMQKAFEKKSEQLENSFAEKLAESEKENFKMLEGLVEIMDSQKNSIKKLTSALETVTSWKGFIYSEDEAEQKSDNREKKFFDVFDKMKKQF